MISQLSSGALKPSDAFSLSFSREYIHISIHTCTMIHVYISQSLCASVKVYRNVYLFNPVTFYMLTGSKNFVRFFAGSSNQTKENSLSAIEQRVPLPGFEEEQER